MPLLSKAQNGATLFFSITMLLFIANGCKSSNNQDAGGYAPPTPQLPVVNVDTTDATTYLEYSASLQGSKDIEIRPQVDGYIDKIYVDEGAYVKRGQALFHIDSRQYVQQLNNAKAGLASAQANLAAAEINVNKLKPLVQNNVISEVQLKSAQAVYNAASSNVAQAQSMVNAAEINLGYTTVKAPVDGYIGKIPLKTGSLVGITTAEPLTVISELKDVHAYYSLSENDFLRFKSQYEGNTLEQKIKNMPPIELVLPDGSVYNHKGKVQIVSGQFDEGTGSISFRAIFPNPERLLRSGNTGKVRVPHIANNAIVVPQESTYEVQDKVFVFALGDSNKVVSKPIVISGKTSHYYFVEGGLKAGETIVYTGIGNLSDGMMIIPQPISMDSLRKAKPL
jgi:membrane fusion protein (multidrug efflux system)